MMPVRYLLGSRLLGESPASPPRSWAFFCCTCGEIWGRAWSTGGVEGWSVISSACENHAPSGVEDWGYVPGSFIHSRTHSSDLPIWAQALALEHLPRSVLLRELEVHITNIERQVRQNGNNGE